MSARPANVLERTLKVARRHPTWTVARTMTLVALVYVLFDLYVHNARQHAALKIAQQQRAAAKTAERLAESRAVEAGQERQRAERNLARATSAVNEMLTAVSESKELLGDRLHMTEVRRQLWELALAFYEEPAAESGDDPAVLRDRTRTCQRVGATDVRPDLARTARLLMGGTWQVQSKRDVQTGISHRFFRTPSWKKRVLFSGCCEDSSRASERPGGRTGRQNS